MYHMIETSRCIGKTNLQVFQKSILISIKSLQGLFKDMQEKFQISFILTSKLNQDALESLFGILRTRGGLDDHPTPINLIYRLRMVLLGKTPGIVHSRTNILPYQEDEITLTNIVLEKAEIEPLLPPDSYEEDMRRWMWYIVFPRKYRYSIQ
ncbi:hypothetical protein JTB14_018591 [Gonioctena quinquepunctata]|nr:hypothetical protein JTB14_018591 [Gonioctena quinquepunctata]